MNLLDFSYRKESVNAKEIFPNLDVRDLKEKFGGDPHDDPHKELLDTALNLWDSGYDYIIKNYGFHDQYKTFTSHCHQITPALGLILKLRGFEKAHYLECYRVQKTDTGFKKVDPSEESNSEARDEFISIQRIPYCCLQVEINREKFYLTGKHIKRIDGEPKAFLSPVCYREMTGVFAHQDNPTKSGIYLETVKPEPLIWMKQTTKDPEPEYFQCYLDMALEL